MPSSFDVCLLMISTSATLSVKRRTHLCEIVGPHMCNAITIGNNSRVAMFSDCQDGGHAPQNQGLPKLAPYPLEPAESVYSSRVLATSFPGSLILPPLVKLNGKVKRETVNQVRGQMFRIISKEKF